VTSFKLSRYFSFMKMILMASLVRWPTGICAKLLTKHGHRGESRSRSNTRMCPHPLQPSEQRNVVVVLRTKSFV
jgi:hypothetical protein